MRPHIPINNRGKPNQGEILGYGSVSPGNGP